MIDWVFAHTPLYLMTQSFWQDEAFSYFLAVRPPLEIIKLTAQDFNPPLYYLLLHFWMKIFGTSEIALRSLSLVFFAGTVFMFSLFLEQIFKIRERKALIYSFLFMLNPFLLYYGFEARMYSLLALLSICSFYFFIKKDKRWYVITTVLGLYTHYFFVFNILIQIVYLFYFKKGEIKDLFKPIIISFILFSPWGIYALPNVIANSSMTWILPTSASDLKGFLAILFTGHENYWNFYGDRLTLVSVILFVITCLGIYFQKKKNHLFWLLIMWSFLAYGFTFIISFQRPLFVPRYLIAAPIGFLLLLIYLIEGMPKKIQTISLVVLFIITFNYTSNESKFKRKGDMRKNVSEVKAIINPGDEVYVSDPIHFFTVAYYIRNNNVYILRDYKDLPNYIGLVLIPRINARPFVLPDTKRAFIIKGNNSYSFFRTF